MRRRLSVFLLASTATVLTAVSALAQDTYQYDEVPPTVDEVLSVLGVAKPKYKVQTRGIVFKEASTQAASNDPAEGATAAAEPASSGGGGDSGASTERNILSVPITFALDSHAVPNRFRPHLDNIGAALRTEQAKQVRLVVTGHTDSRGGDAYNSLLSNRRAHAVINYLADVAGVDRSRLIAAGEGEAKPLPGLPTTDARNRRVDFSAL